MPFFSDASKEKLATCDERLQRVMLEAIKEIDFSVIYGRRGKEEQNAAYAAGHSKLQYPRSKHNKTPSLAVDIVPYPLLFKAKQEDFVELAHVILNTAKRLKIGIKWGGDWNQNDDWKDEPFFDGAHFELI